MKNRTIKILAIMEASSVTGPAKNLIEFCRGSGSAANLSDSPVTIRAAIATFDRNASPSVVSLQVTADSEAKTPSPGNAFVTAATAYGIDVHTIRERFRFDPALVPDLRRIVEQLQPDIIQTHGVKSHFLMRLSGLWRRHSWVAFHHGYTTTDAKMLAYNQLDRWSLRVADRIITVSQAMAMDLIARGVPPENIIVLHNSVRIDEVAASHGSGADFRRHLGLREAEQVILAVGRLSREKGHLDLIHAVRLLTCDDAQSKIKLIVVGDGPERPRLERLVEQSGLNTRVLFVGHVSDVRPYYEIADVLALPSHSEGSPNVVLEAMASGIPVVATAVGGVPEIINSGVNGLLVAVSDPATMASAIKQVLVDSDMAYRLTENARNTIITKHSPAARHFSLITTYLGLAGSRVRPEDLSSANAKNGISGPTTAGVQNGRAARLPTPMTLMVDVGAKPSRAKDSRTLASLARKAAITITHGAYSAGKNAVMFVYLYSGFVQLRDAVLSALGRSRVVVVYYHRIGRPDVLTKPPDEFARDLEFYKSHYQCLSLSELCRRLRSGDRFNRRSVVITFDDGYRDNFTGAVPVLRAAGLTATFFVATGFIGTSKEFPHDQRSTLASRPPAIPSRPKLDWDDLRAMEAEGFEVGSHTINHTNLGAAALPELEVEVRGSLDTLNKELGAKPRPFSFPWGKPSDISAAAINAVERAGYYSASSAYGGTNTYGASPLEVRRIDAGNGNIGRLAFRAKVAGFDPDYYRLKLRGRKDLPSMRISPVLEISLND
jgi:glycosyltransferase involved in cell wall biosynthesis/peptidoglycan/xylan/chitin deacetylase (PgdA/CDA1 family)